MFDILLFTVSCITAVLYAGLAMLLIRGLRRLPETEFTGLRKFSIVVAARNEERRLPSLMESLLRLDYPHDHFEIIVVDDRSTDATSTILEKYLRTTDLVRVVTIDRNATDMPNKKNALRHAVAVSRHEFLAFTDADCVVPPGWLRELSRQFTDAVGVVAGYSPYRFERQHRAKSYLRFEEYKNSLIAAGAIGVHKAFLCTGRNLAYQRSVYDEIGGFEKIKHSVSGDDDLFLQAVRTTTRWEIRYMVAPGSAVETSPPETMSQFIHQRTRHISASKHYDAVSATAYGISHLFLILIIMLLFLHPVAGFIFLLIRMNLDAIFIAHGMTVIKEHFSTREFILNTFAEALYTIAIGPLGLFKKFQWKESTV